GDLDLVGVADVDRLVAGDGVGLVGPDGEVVVAADAGVVVDGDRLVLVVAGGGVEILLGRDRHALLAAAVAHLDLVVAGTAGGAHALHRAVGRGGGLRVGRGVLGVVGAADDEGAIGIPVEEGHRHLPADAGEEHRPAHPELGDAQPAARGVVLLGGPVPEEADLDAAVLVDVDVLRAAGGAGDDHRLDAADLGFVRPARGGERRVLGDGGEVVPGGLLPALALRAELDDDEIAVEERLVDAGDGERGPGHE